jgi:AraC-like DNA-binding protein
MHEIRAATLSVYLEVAGSIGLDGYWMLRHAGIPASALENPENRLPAAVVVRLFEQSARRSGREDFALLMAESRSFASLGPISLLLDHLANIREVLGALAVYRRHMNDIVAIDLEEQAGTALIKIGFMPEFAKVQITDFAVALGSTVLSGASRGHWRPATVHLTRPTPADPAPWRRFFQAPVEFGSFFNGFACPVSALDIANPNANPLMAQHAERLLRLVPLPREDSPASDRVRRAIALLMPNGQARLGPVAAQLGVAPRALQRSLEAEGTTFAGLLGEVRRELAQVYLDGAQSVTAVSEQLGYASPSAFTRWFVSEFGLSPHSWRSDRRALEEAPPPFWAV